MIFMLVILFVIFVFIGLFVVNLKANRKDRSRKVFGLIGVVIASCIATVLLSILFFFWAFGSFRDSRPVVKDNFYLHETGVIREYTIAPRFKDWLAGANGDYEITVYLEKVPSSAGDKIGFHPRVKVTTLLNKVPLESITIDKPFSVTLDERYEKKVLITKLPKVILGIRNPRYTVKVEVLQGDENLLPYVDNFNTQIAVDNYP